MVQKPQSEEVFLSGFSSIFTSSRSIISNQLIFQTMINLQPRLYVVKKNDNLDMIARQNGYTSWKILYGSSCNRNFRLKRPDPNKILPGDNIFLLPKTSDVLAVLQLRSQQLITLKSQFNESTDKEIKSLKYSFAKVTNMGQTVDTVKTALDILTGLAGLVSAGFKASKAAVDVVAACNKALIKDVIAFVHDPVTDALLGEYADSEILDDNIITVLSQTIVKAYTDMTSPSFWAKTIAGLMNGESWQSAVINRPQDVYDKAVQQISRQRENMNRDIDKKIYENNKLIRKFSSKVDQSLPIQINRV